jgi:hypothetical protein
MYISLPKFAPFLSSLKKFNSLRIPSSAKLIVCKLLCDWRLELEGLISWGVWGLVAMSRCDVKMVERWCRSRSRH